MKVKLLENLRNFYKDAIIQADKYPVKAYIFTEPDDNGRMTEFIKILLQHRIKVYRTSKDLSKNGLMYSAENSFIVPLQQPEYRFIRSLFEPVKEFTDSTFYDISTWVLPMSFNINYTGITLAREMEGLTGAEITQAPVSAGTLIASENPYAFLFEWNEYYAPKALYAIQNAGIITRVSNEKFTYSDLNKTFNYGTVVVPVAGQSILPDSLTGLMKKVAEECGITIYGVSTGLTSGGIDLGSNKIMVLKKPSVAMFAGSGANSSDAGEIWHLLDTRFNVPVTMITASGFNQLDMDRYNVLIITGSPDINPAGVEKIKTWNRKGGTIIGFENGNNWLSGNNLTEIEFVPSVTAKVDKGVYVNRSADGQVQQIPGSIFETKLDLSHPLCFGYTRDILPVFKSTTSAAKKNSNIYNNPVIYSDSPLLSGYCTPENIQRLKGSAFASVNSNRIISIYDNTNFRAIWYGTNKIFLNAIFFGQIIR
jgi:hypothetical protein